MSVDGPSTLRFEMSKEKLSEVNAKFGDVQAAIDRVMAQADA